MVIYLFHPYQYFILFTLLFQASESLETNKLVSGEQQYNQQLTDERSCDPVNLLVPSFVNNDVVTLTGLNLSSSLLLGDSGFHYSMLISRGGVQYSKVGSVAVS